MLRPLPLRLSLPLFALLIVVLGALVMPQAGASELRMIWPALDGDGALVFTPDGGTLLIDGGADGAALATWLGQKLPFAQRRIDTVILTRADAQTLPGQLAALKRYRIGQAIVAGGEQRSSSLDAWWELLETQQATIRTAAAGDTLALGRCSIRILAAQAERLVFKLQCATTTAYFLQALDADGEAALQTQALDPATIVMYPWSATSDTLLLRLLQPQAIIFSDAAQSGGNVTWADRQVGTARLYHKAINGQIMLRDNGQKTTMTVERP